MNVKTVAVAMSGGVDSSVAAALLKQEGYNVTGLTMKLWDGKDDPAAAVRQSCYGPGEAREIEQTRKVAEQLELPLQVIDLSAEFRSEVLEYFKQEYLSGRTPNPCLMCNRKLKFEALLEKAQENGITFDLFATGHYSRVEYSKASGRYLLKKGKDEEKDQSYFLAFLSQEQLSRTLFPVGGYTKAEVRELARNFGLELENKPESQDFTAGGYRSVIGETKPGFLKNDCGEILGEHAGITNFTIGQRRGLGISSPEPMYVIDIDPETGDITVGSKDNIYRNELTASGLNWISIEKLNEPLDLKVKIRYAHKEAVATVSPLGENRMQVMFEKPQMAVTPGQAVVFYDGDTVVGAGIIERYGS